MVIYDRLERVVATLSRSFHSNVEKVMPIVPKSNSSDFDGLNIYAKLRSGHGKNSRCTRRWSSEGGDIYDPSWRKIHLDRRSCLLLIIPTLPMISAMVDDSTGG